MSGYNSLFFLGAGATTYAMVKTSADRDIQNWFQDRDPLGNQFPVGMYWAGIIVQPAVGAGLWLGGYLVENNELIGGGSAVLQALGINSLFTLSLKYATGRTRPGCCNDADDFDFRVYNQTIFTKRQSWPSGHTSSTFAMSAALHAYFDKPIFAWIGHPLAIFVGLSMVDWDYHWTSDVVAGALIGAVVGYTVGRNFRKMYGRKVRKDERDSVKPGDFALTGFLPYTGAQGSGLAAYASFQ